MRVKDGLMKCYKGYMRTTTMKGRMMKRLLLLNLLFVLGLTACSPMNRKRGT